MNKEINIGDVIMVRDVTGSVTADVAIVTAKSHSGDTVDIMIPSARCYETTVSVKDTNDLSCMVTEYAEFCTDDTIKRYEQVSKVFGELAKMLREHKEGKKDGHQQDQDGDACQD